MTIMEKQNVITVARNLSLAMFIVSLILHAIAIIYGITLYNHYRTETVGIYTIISSVISGFFTNVFLYLIYSYWTLKDFDVYK